MANVASGHAIGNPCTAQRETAQGSGDATASKEGANKNTIAVACLVVVELSVVTQSILHPAVK
jgi:hypothetical protein